MRDCWLCDRLSGGSVLCSGGCGRVHEHTARCVAVLSIVGIE